VLASVAKVIRVYGARTVADQYMAAGVVDRLRSEGIWVRAEPMTATSKPPLSELRAAWPPESLDLLDLPPLLAELRRLRSRYRAGSASVINPRVERLHGDLAQALALAVYKHDRCGLQRDDGLGASVGTDGRSIAEALGETDWRGSGHLSTSLPSYGGYL
jgi:hypothetical protein